MQDGQRKYLPAAGHDWALWLYDPIVKVLGADQARKKLLDQASLHPRHRVLDIGCGTGTLAVLIKRIHPEVEVVGLDPDPKALARARERADRAGVSVQFDRGYSDSLPYPNAYFDRVFSSMMFHHLLAAEKEKTLQEALRVLKSDGSFHMADFGGKEDRTTGWLANRIHSNERLKDNSVKAILAMMSRAGFGDARSVGHWDFRLGLGRAYYYQATATK